MWSVGMYSIDYLYWNFIGNLLDRDFELVQAPASFGEAWLEARGARRMIWFAFPEGYRLQTGSRPRPGISL
ncbi:hypothetical protein PO124_08340 [Bacillus licheniformis]|nr:hypothetical protein [Bacillus licheniformis]